MNRALYHKSIGDIGRYFTTINSLIISLFKEDRERIFKKKQELEHLINRGGTYKEEAADVLYMLCVDLLEPTYLRKHIQKKEKRTEDFKSLRNEGIGDF